MHGNPRKWREEVFIDTQRRAVHYPCAPSKKVFHSRSLTPTHGITPTHVTVERADSIEAGKLLLDAGHSPLVLNFASDRHAGGGVGSGAGAQEESLWRRTNLCETQFQDFYPLRAHPPEGVYTPNATVFKSKETDGCTLLTTPYQLSFLAVPAIRNPELTPEGHFTPRDAALFKKKVELIFQVAASHGHNALVLGPFGCGAWNCPPADVAGIFKELLTTYDGIFKKVVFACYVVEGASRGYHDQSVVNYEVFKRVLG
jgi:uncharacterized protein (TIGR02452 family)